MRQEVAYRIIPLATTLGSACSGRIPPPLPLVDPPPLDPPWKPPLEGPPW